MPETHTPYADELRRQKANAAYNKLIGHSENGNKLFYTKQDKQTYITPGAVSFYTAKEHNPNTTPNKRDESWYEFWKFVVGDKKTPHAFSPETRIKYGIERARHKEKILKIIIISALTAGIILATIYFIKN